MAKKSKVAKNEQRKATVARYDDRRRAAKRDAADLSLSPERRQEAMDILHSLPRDASPIRVRGRGFGDGRPRGYLRKFGLSRIKFREAALRGELPGVKKSSW